jgi:hypothetical protein
LPSAKNSFDTDNPLLDLNEAGSADGDDELFDEDIGTGDPKTRTGGHISLERLAPCYINRYRHFSE